VSAAGTENSVEVQKPWLFKPGQSGNPKGKPKGARNRLGEEFIAALADDFQEHGKTAITAVRTERPQDYLKVIAMLMPKQMELKPATFDGIDAEDIAALILAAREALGLAEGGGSGTVIEGVSEQVGELSPISEAAPVP